MKRLISSLVVALALMLPASSVMAASVVSSFSVKGQVANAFFFTTDGCVDTFVFVSASDGQIKETGSRRTLSSVADVFIDVYDFCSDVNVLSAAGFAELPPSDFTASSLSAASLTTSIVVEDFVSNSTFSVDIDVVWTATGSAFREKGRFSFTTPGFRFTDRFDAMVANATATGTVTDGVTNFTPEVGDGQIANVKQGTKVVEKL